MATIPITLQSVLAAQNKVVTPSASPTAAANQAQLEANKAKAAEREAARQSATVVTPTVLKPIDPNTQEGSVAFYKARGFDDNSAANMAKDYQVKMGNTTSWIDDTSVTGTQGFQDYLGSTISNYERTTGKKLDKNSYNSMYNTGKGSSLSPKLDTLSSPKVQVGKLVSDFNSTLRKTGSDKDAYYAGINYAGLTDEDKKRADTLFDMRQKVKKAPVATTAPVVPANMFDTYKTDTKELTKKAEEVTEKGRKEMISNEEAINADAQKMNDELISEITSYQNEFETKQNDLLSSYESNRLNQVQGDIRRALLSRGVDISKIPQEQLLALSGEIGAKAFSDISGAKERAISAIENARQNKIAKIQQLKANKLISNSESKRQIANINSTADQAILNSKMKEAEVVFGIEQAKEAKQEGTQANVAQAIANMGTYLGTTGTQLRDLYAATQGAKSVGEAMNIIQREVVNPESPIYKNLKSNEERAAAQQRFLNQIKLMQEETDRIKANKTGGSGSRTTTNPDYTGANK